MTMTAKGTPAPKGTGRMMGALAALITLMPTTAWAGGDSKAEGILAIVIKAFSEYSWGLLFSKENPWLIAPAILTLTWMLGLKSVRGWVGRLGGFAIAVFLIGYGFGLAKAVMKTFSTATIVILIALGITMGVGIFSAALTSFIGLVKWMWSFSRNSLSETHPNPFWVAMGALLAAGTLCGPRVSNSGTLFLPAILSGLGGVWFCFVVYRKVRHGQTLAKALGIGGDAPADPHAPPALPAPQPPAQPSPQPTAPGPPALPPPATATADACPHGCGAQNPAGARFCVNCARPLVGGAPPTNATPAPPRAADDDPYGDVI